MNTNEQKAREFADNAAQETDYKRSAAYEAAMEMAEHKDIEFKNQEQSLLWTLYSILDNLAVEGEARENSIKEFKEYLKYYKDE